MSDKSHDLQVYEFLQSRALDSPELFKSVCARYPTKNYRAVEKIRRREIPFSSLSSTDSESIGLDVSYDEDEE